MSVTPIPKRLKWRIFKRDYYTCRYCGAIGVPMEIDHVFPESLGGPTVIENLVTACETCNRQKGNKLGMHPLPVDYLERISYANRVIGWYEDMQAKQAEAEHKRKTAQIYSELLAIYDEERQQSQESMKKARRWRNGRRLLFRLTKLVPLLSALILITGCILLSVGWWQMRPPLLVGGILMNFVSIGVIKAYEPLLRWNVRAWDNSPYPVGVSNGQA